MSSSRRYCCIRDCSNTPFRLKGVQPNIKFYSFPESTMNASWKLEKRRKWINAVKNYVKNPKDWEPSRKTTICSAHFVNNTKSENPLHPAYVPTIFPGAENVKKSAQSLNRFERQQRRANKRVNMNDELIANQGSEMEHYNNNCSENEQSDSIQTDLIDGAQKVVSRRSITCQTEPRLTNVLNEPTFFFCNLFCQDGISTAEVQVNIQEKRTADKMCAVSLPTAKKDTHDVGCDPIDEDSRKLNCPGFHGISSIKDNGALSSLTGVSFSIFSFLLNTLPDESNSKVKKDTKLLITLTKMKTGLSYTALAALFNIHRSSVQRVFVQTLQSLNILLKQCIFWPSKATVKTSLPEAFKKDYPNTRVIIDCTEVNTETPPQIKERVLMYSEYKHHYTIKFLVGCTPSGFVSFVSKCYGGRASDCFITNDCGIIDLIEPGDVVLADKGFPTIKTQVEGKNAIFVMPPFLHNPQFTPEEVEETYKIASVRIHIERIMQRIKDFNIFSKIPVSLFPHVDEIIFVACALINLENPIIQE